MRKFSCDPRDLIGGLALVALGAAAIIIAADYPFGAARRMGPGYFPIVLGYICAGLGVLVVIKGFMPMLRDAGPIERPSMRAVFGITAAMGAFILAGEHLGLVPAILLVAGGGALVDRANSLRTAAYVAIGVTVCGVAIFSWGLGIVFPLFAGWN
jgi:hypothetical protein